MAIRTVFTSFSLADVEDPDIYAAFPIMEWQKTDHGKWCMEHAITTPSYQIMTDANTYSYKCVIYGELEDKDYTFYQLKWSNSDYTFKP